MRTTLLLDDSPIAMQIGFVRGEQAWAFKIAHDPWKGKYSPGSLLDLLLAEALHDTDIAWMDQCADAGHPTIDGIWDGRITMQSLWIGTTSRLGQVARMAGPIQGMHHGVRRSRPLPSNNEPPIMRVDPRLDSLDEPFLVEHDLISHPLFELDRLAELVDLLPDKRLEYNRGDVDIVQNPLHVPTTGMTAAETIRNIDTSESWMLLRNVEADPEYRSLLDRAVDEFCARIGPAAANDLRREAFIFISSPHAVTPYHVDPEHNVLLQIRGSKTMSIFDTSAQEDIHTIELERFFAGGHCNLETEPPESRQMFELVPGLGLSVPVAAAHVVHNGPEVSISFSMTFRSPTRSTPLVDIGSTTRSEAEGCRQSMMVIPSIGCWVQPARWSTGRNAFGDRRSLGRNSVQTLELTRQRRRRSPLERRRQILRTSHAGRCCSTSY